MLRHYFIHASFCFIFASFCFVVLSLNRYYFDFVSPCFIFPLVFPLPSLRLPLDFASSLIRHRFLPISRLFVFFWFSILVTVLILYFGYSAKLCELFIFIFNLYFLNVFIVFSL